MLLVSNHALQLKLPTLAQSQWLDTKVKPADSGKLGATLAEGGTNFALWAPAAEAVELCLFDLNQAGQIVETRFALTHRDGPIWHGFLAGITSGQRYGFRVYGEWNPARGLRFNPAKVLIDPYANLISGELKNAPEIYGHYAVDEFGNGDLGKQDNRDSAPYVPLSVVSEISKPEITRPRIPWNKTIIYEAHVKGLTFRNLEIPESDRGTYRALSHPTVIAHLQKLGVTALELLPIHHYLTETSLRSRGRMNHWGYNPIAFSAPHAGYGATDNPVEELQEAISKLHEAGIEVILDVVYNHSAEQGKAGPTLSFRGVDNKAFYRHIGDDEYEDVTGCGNTLDTRNPFVTRLILDSLRWWAEVIGVDGFRFDLTTALSRNDGLIDTNGSLISAITADPILRDLKLIAEPWDIKGYALGDFPHPWREWNDAYRDAVRQFWLADSAQGFSAGVSDLASRITGSDDVFYYRGPTSSINFITAHDGFTLTDLVSYQDKHNEPNGEDNRDGTTHNRSWNLGIEGPSENIEIERIRERLKKSLLATLMISSGVPMLTMGDEVGRTQNGSNNAYSLDPNKAWDAPENFGGGWALSWDKTESDLLDSIAALSSIRAKYLSEIIEEFFTGSIDQGTKRKDIAWFHRDGLEMGANGWQDSSLRHLAFMLDATHKQSLFVIFNGDNVAQEFTLPNAIWGESFRTVFDSAIKVSQLAPELRKPSDQTQVQPHSVQIWFVNRSAT